MEQPQQIKADHWSHDVAPPRPPHTPDDVVIGWEPPRPPESPDLGVKLDLHWEGTPKHRLVTIGDSLTHGFKNLAISDTDHSWPAIVAYELGWYERFRRPKYCGPKDCPGLPLNLEALVRRMEKAVGEKPRLIAWIFMLASLWWTAWRVKWYWQWGPGRQPEHGEGYNHDLAIFGWDVRDSFEKTVEWCERAVNGQQSKHRPRSKRLRRRRGNPASRLLWPLHALIWFLVPRVSHAQERAAIRALWGGPDKKTTQVTAARSLGEEGTDEKPGEGEGIETLVVALGSNNALRTVISLTLTWSHDPEFRNPEEKGRFTIWQPKHFAEDLSGLVAEVESIKARHVIWASVPHVTIIPLARGVGDKPYYSRYFPRYTYVPTPDAEFDGNVHACITADEARTVDSVIDAYNGMIQDAVRSARNKGRDWWYFDGCTLLDSMAYRRYLEDVRTQPDWFKAYQPPDAFSALTPLPDTRYMTSDKRGNLTGGLIGLDGVHPTALGYGIIAQEVIKIMEMAGVEFRDKRGNRRQSPVSVDWGRLIDAEPLVNNPLRTLGEDLGIAGMILEGIDVAKTLVS